MRRLTPACRTPHAGMMWDEGGVRVRARIFDYVVRFVRRRSSDRRDNAVAGYCVYNGMRSAMCRQHRNRGDVFFGAFASAILTKSLERGTHCVVGAFFLLEFLWVSCDLLRSSAEGTVSRFIRDRSFRTEGPQVSHGGIIIKHDKSSASSSPLSSLSLSSANYLGARFALNNNINTTTTTTKTSSLPLCNIIVPRANNNVLIN